MTGTDLIIYILRNNLEHNDVDYIMNEIFITVEDVATKFNIGIETVRAWYQLGLIDGFKLNGHLYFPKNVVDPRG